MLRHLICRLDELRRGVVFDLEAELHPLRYLFWEATRRCNLRCRHCGSDCSAAPDQPDLPAEFVDRTLRRFAEAYDARRILLVVTGGEPLLRPDLYERLALARELGYRFGMVSNGYALDGLQAERLASLGLETVVVSLDGPEDCHDWLRDRPGAFLRARNALMALRRAGVPIVEAVTCVTPSSLDRLGETYRILLDSGVTHWRIFDIFPAGRARDDRTLLLEPGELVRLISLVADLRVVGKRDGLVVNLSEEGYLGGEWDRQVRDFPYACRAGVQIAGLMADGSLAACPNLPAWACQGSIYKDDPVAVWEERYQLFRDRSWTKKGECAKCSRWHICKGNSLHLYDEHQQGPCWCHHGLLEAADRGELEPKERG